MTKVSRKPLPKEDWEEFYGQICNILTLFENKKEVRRFLNDILTYTERKMLSKRLQIARALLDGVTYDLIEKRLNVTPNTITTVNTRLNLSGDGYRTADKILTELEVEEIARTKERIQRMENPINVKRKTVLGGLARMGLKVAEKRLHQRARRQSVKKAKKVRKYS